MRLPTFAPNQSANDALTYAVFSGNCTLKGKCTQELTHFLGSLTNASSLWQRCAIP